MIGSDEGLSLETSAFESLNSGQFFLYRLQEYDSAVISVFLFFISKLFVCILKYSTENFCKRIERHKRFLSMIISVLSAGS